MEEKVNQKSSISNLNVEKIIDNEIIPIPLLEKDKIIMNIYEKEKVLNSDNIKIKDCILTEINNLNKEEINNVIIEEIDKEIKITIIVHLFVESLWDEFLEYIKNVKEVFKHVNVIITLNENSKFDKIIKYTNKNFIILKIKNKGVDIYSFLVGIKYLRKYNIDTDFILKLHTKTTTFSKDVLEWRKELIKPITNINNLNMIHYYFKNIKNIGYIGSQKCILPKNYDLYFPNNMKGLNILYNKFPHIEKEWTDFNAGNIFWINNVVLNKYLTDDFIDYCINNFSYGKPPCNLTSNTINIEYLCERLFTGNFCYNNTNILVNDYTGAESGINLQNSYFYQPNVFSFHIPKNLFI